MIEHRIDANVKIGGNGDKLGFVKKIASPRYVLPAAFLFEEHKRRVPRARRVDVLEDKVAVRDVVAVRAPLEAVVGDLAEDDLMRRLAADGHLDAGRDREKSGEGRSGVRRHPAAQVFPFALDRDRVLGNIVSRDRELVDSRALVVRHVGDRVALLDRFRVLSHGAVEPGRRARKERNLAAEVSDIVAVRFERTRIDAVAVGARAEHDAVRHLAEPRGQPFGGVCAVG